MYVCGSSLTRGSLSNQVCACVQMCVYKCMCTNVCAPPPPNLHSMYVRAQPHVPYTHIRMQKQAGARNDDGGGQRQCCHTYHLRPIPPPTHTHTHAHTLSAQPVSFVNLGARYDDGGGQWQCHHTYQRHTPFPDARGARACGQAGHHYLPQNEVSA